MNIPGCPSSQPKPEVGTAEGAAGPEIPNSQIWLQEELTPPTHGSAALPGLFSSKDSAVLHSCNPGDTDTGLVLNINIKYSNPLPAQSKSWNQLAGSTTPRIFQVLQHILLFQSQTEP